MFVASSFQLVLDHNIIRTFFNYCLNPNPCDLVTELFKAETSEPWISNPLECFVTAWCVANSSPTSRWSLRFEDLSMLANFVDHFERFGCYSMNCKHGTIVGLYVDSSKYRALSKYSIILSSLSSLFPWLEYFCLNHISVVDVTHFVLFSSDTQTGLSMRPVCVH